MTRNPLKDGNISQNSSGLGTVTRKMVRGRAMELALIKGDWLHKASRLDIEDAQAQLTGGLDMSPAVAGVEAPLESEHWNPIPGSAGRKVPASSGDDEDEEGRSDNERLVEEGVIEAEHDHMIQAAQEAADADRR
jgi:hypothetical protein